VFYRCNQPLDSGAFSHVTCGISISSNPGAGRA